MEEDKFEKAAEAIKNAASNETLKSKLNNELLLQFYGWFKVGTVGECNTERPGGLLNKKEKAKWDAWKAASDETTDQAAGKQKYVDLLLTLAPEEDW